MCYEHVIVYLFIFLFLRGIWLNILVVLNGEDSNFHRIPVIINFIAIEQITIGTGITGTNIDADTVTTIMIRILLFFFLYSFLTLRTFISITDGHADVFIKIRLFLL